MTNGIFIGLLLLRSLEHFAEKSIVVDGTGHRGKHPFWARNKAPQRSYVSVDA